MTQASLKVRFAGPLVTFQDGGRPGQMRFGVSASGPMDRLAATAANVALGNAPGATLIEVSMGGLVLECTEGALSVAVTGGDFTLDETTSYLLSYDDPDFEGGTLGADLALVEITPGTGGQTGGDAYFSAANPYRHYLASINTVDETGAGGGTGGASPPGGGGWDGDDPGGNIP